MPRSCLCCQTDGYVQNGTFHTIDRDEESSAGRLSSSSADTYVRPARGHKAVFAEALVGAGSVHAASVLAGADTGSWLCALINV